MNSSINCELKGSYKVDLFSGGKLVESTDWFSNDITNTGLCYPFIYSFAECFRFLSLGEAPMADADRKTATGLSSPMLSLDTADGWQSAQYIGWQGYEIGGQHNESFGGSFSSACGTKFTNQGINLYRGWTLPTGAVENGNVMADAAQIESFMVSPSSGEDVTGASAFSLVNRSVLIPAGFTATITYQLSLNFQNYQNFTLFSGKTAGNNGYFNTGNASTGTSGSEISLLSGWSNLSGIYRQILPGLQIVDSLGACVIPAWGDQMEPKYTDCRKMYFYMSPDISQFAVSPYGSLDISESGAYNSNGLMANYTQLVSRAGGDLNIYSDSEAAWPSNPDAWYYSGVSQETASTVQSVPILSNIRLANLLSIADYSGNSIPADTFTYQDRGFVSPIVSQQPLAFATPGLAGFDLVNSPNYGQRAIYSTYLKRLPISSYGNNTATGLGSTSYRDKKVTKRGLFSPIQSMGKNSRYGSLVLAYLSSQGSIGELTFQPYMDFLFFDTSGRAADMPHYRLIPDIYLTERGSGVSQAKFYITGANGSLPSSVNRIFAAKGFMGQGMEVSPTYQSGLNTEHPFLLGEIEMSGANQPSGYLFGGQTLNESVPGDMTVNDGTGWGAVYGVIASEEFYNAPLDTCLLDNRPWSGINFSGFTGVGGIPNPTGDADKLFWPTVGSRIGVSVSGVSYYLSGVGDYPDPTNFYSSGVYQMVGNVLYGGQSLISPLVDENSNSLYYFSTTVNPTDWAEIVTTSDPITATGITFYNSGAGTKTGIVLGLITGEDPNNPGYVTFSGFNFSNLLTSRGSGRAWTYSDINTFVYSGATNGLVDTSNSYYLTKYNAAAQTFSSLTGTGIGTWSLAPTQFKKPSGIIRHVENWNGSGNRLLPNYAYPNNQGINYYSPVVGGAFPGMSMENGMQMFFDFAWSGA